MKRLFFLLGITLLLAVPVKAIGFEEGFRDIGDDTSNQTENDRSSMPKNKIVKGVVVYVGFLYEGELWSGSSSWNTKWPENYIGPKDVMDDVDDFGGSNFVLPTTYLDNGNPIHPSNTSLSNFYLKSSQGNMSVLMDTYPKRVDITPESGENFYHYSKKVLEKIQEYRSDPNIDFDWSIYDNYNASWDTIPDGKLDFVTIICRNNQGVYPDPTVSLDGYLGGTASTQNPFDCYDGFNFDGIDVGRANNGFSYYEGLYGDINTKRSVFVHEVGHKYGFGHNNCNNNVTASYFHTTYGESIMNIGSGFYGLMSARELEHMGYESYENDGGNIKYFTENTPINNIGGYHEITLTDFATTRKSIKVKLPNIGTTTGQDHNLWLEFHTGEDSFDKRFNFIKDGNEGPIPQAGKGLLAYITRDNPNPLAFTGYNYHKLIHADGNWDFENDSIYERGDTYWKNPIYNFRKTAANPYSTHNLASAIRSDFYTNKSTSWGDLNALFGTPNGKIDYDNNSNCANGNESIYLIKESGNLEWGLYGNKAPFTTDRKVGISSNPSIFNSQKYTSNNNNTEKSEPIYLNGVSFEIVDYNQSTSNSMKIRIRFNDLSVS